VKSHITKNKQTYTVFADYIQ